MVKKPIVNKKYTGTTDPKEMLIQTHVYENEKQKV